MPDYCEDSNYQIGLMPNNTVTLARLHIPAPDQVVYRPATVHYVRSDYSRVGDGFISVDWIWDTMSLPRLSGLLSFLDGEEFASVYIVTDKREGTYPNPKVSFAMFYAIMWKPMLSGEDGIFVAQSPYVTQTIRIRFVDLVEQSGYL